MIGLLREDNIGQYLSAFADGELDAQGMLLVLDHLAAHPESIGLIREQQLLRLAAQRTFRGETPAAPDALQNTVAQLAAAARRENAGRRVGSRRVPGLRWPLYVVATLLLILGGLVGRYLLQPTARLPVPEPASRLVVPAFIGVP